MDKGLHVASEKEILDQAAISVICTEVNLLHLLKAYLSIDLTPLPMETEVRAVQFEKAYPLMDMTLFGIVTEVRSLQ